MAKSKITNTAAGARGVRTDGGLVMVEPGQTVEVELAKGEELYEGLVEAASEEAALKSLNRDELITRAEQAGIAVETDDNKADLIRKITEANTAP